MSADSKRNGYGFKIRGMVDSFYYTAGCIGPLPVGVNSAHDDPISTTILTTISTLGDLFMKKGTGIFSAVSDTTKNTFNGYNKNVMCHPLEPKIIPITQYSVQLLSPSVSSTHEIGVNPLKYAYHHNAGDADVTVMMIFNKRRDFNAYAYSYSAK
jgi:hypothetical protein